jgi:hypothetical protein
MKFGLLFLCASLSALSFIVPSSGILIVLASVLLFSLLLYYQVSFKDGIWWGCIFFSLQESGIFYSLFCMAGKSWLSCTSLIPVFVSLIFYQALYSGLWFYTIGILTKSTRLHTRLMITVIITFLFIVIVDHYILWIFGTIEGYPLAHPLLPLAEQPWLLTLLPSVGKHALTLIFLASAGLIAYVLQLQGFFKRFIISSVALTPWFISLLLYVPSKTTPVWLSQIAVLPETFYNPSDTAKTIKQVKQKIQTLIYNHPHIQVVLLPESALYLCDLSKHQELIKEWNSSHLGRPIHIITGAFCKEQETCYNTVYWIFNGTIKQRFYKKHALLLTEGLPRWAHNSSIATLYHRDRPYITPSQNQRPLFKINDTLKLVPYICSELFLNNYPDDRFIGVPIASFCNDTWIEVAYLERLMKLMHRFRALQWKRDILYLAYDSQACYDKQGHEWSLEQ